MCIPLLHHREHLRRVKRGHGVEESTDSVTVLEKRLEGMLYTQKRERPTALPATTRLGCKRKPCIHTTFTVMVFKAAGEGGSALAPLWRVVHSQGGCHAWQCQAKLCCSQPEMCSLPSSQKHSSHALGKVTVESNE